MENGRRRKNIRQHIFLYSFLLYSISYIYKSTWWPRTTIWVEFFWLVYYETTSCLESGFWTSLNWIISLLLYHAFAKKKQQKISYPKIPHLQSDWHWTIPHPVLSCSRPILKNKSPDWHSFGRIVLFSANMGTTVTWLSLEAPRVVLDPITIRNVKIKAENTLRNFLLCSILMWD